MANNLYQNKEWLWKRLFRDHKTAEQIAVECGTSKQQVYRYINKFGLKK